MRVHILGLLFAVCAHHADAKPNVVLVMADDLGWGDVGFNGNTVIQTPHLDAMAANGLNFSRFYAAAPVCSPTRGSCLTGRHPFRYGITHANTGHLKKEEITLSETLKEQGYATGHFGKWHLGTLTKTVKEANRGGPRGAAHFAPPQEHGFDVCFSTESKVPTHSPLRAPKTFPKGASLKIGWDALTEDDSWKPYGTHFWTETGAMVNEPLLEDGSKVIMDRALPFIKKAAATNQPFFAVVWFHAPHLPVVASKRHQAPYQKHDLHERNYYGCITALDEQVGRLRAHLRELDVANDTMVWFCSDNGPEVNATSPGSTGEFRGRKRSLYEGGVRVPALLEWPAKIKHARTTAFPAVTSDYLPTIFNVLDLALPERELDGINLLPAIHDPGATRQAPIGFQSRGTVAWHHGNMKLVYQEKRPKDLELYDLNGDPHETNNLASAFPDKALAMQQAAQAWQASCGRGD